MLINALRDLCPLRTRLIPRWPMNAGPRPLLRVSSHDPLSSYLFIYLFRLSLDWIFRGGKNKKITKYREFKSNLFGLIKIIGNKFLNVDFEEEITSFRSLGIEL